MERIHNFSNEEKFDMITLYLQAHRNAETASTRYLELYPERQQPHKTYYRRIVTNLLNYGAFENKRNHYEKDNHERDVNVLNIIAESPSTSVRSVQHQSNIPKSTVHQILKKHGYHPYKPTIVQGLREGDYDRRLQFCQWYIEKCREIPEFPNLVIWSDETRFTNCGVFNKHNRHHWSLQNPHVMEQRRLQSRFGFNVWCGLLGNRLVGPFLFDYNLNGERYLNLLREEIIPAIRRLVPNAAEFQRLWFQQDGCPAHNTVQVRTYLTHCFGQNVIANNGPVMWPARSPDLTPLDFYLWGQIKNEIYEFEPPVNRNELEARIREAFNLLNGNTLGRVTRKILKNCEMCRNANGRHFEHLPNNV